MVLLTGAAGGLVDFCGCRSARAGRHHKVNGLCRSLQRRVATENSGGDLPKKGERFLTAPQCIQLSANSLASAHSDLFSFWPSPSPVTARVRLRRIPMPSV